MLYDNKYGYYAYLKSTYARYGHIALFTSSVVCLDYVLVKGLKELKVDWVNRVV